MNKHQKQNSDHNYYEVTFSAVPYHQMQRRIKFFADPNLSDKDFIDLCHKNLGDDLHHSPAFNAAARVMEIENITKGRCTEVAS